MLNSSLSQITEIFVQGGGEFVVAPQELQQKLTTIKAFIFDWDGVFNDGSKTGESGSSFNEADSMGTNLARFGYWLQHNSSLPFTAIITGEQNPSAIKLAEREHFNAIYFKTRNKTEALKHLQHHFNIEPKQIAYCFDDVLDLPIAEVCGVRFLISRNGSPLFADYAKQNQLCDYISGQAGGANAVREICELVLGLNGQFSAAVKKRCEFGETYQQYLAQRNAQETEKFSYNEKLAQISSEA